MIIMEYMFSYNGHIIRIGVTMENILSIYINIRIKPEPASILYINYSVKGHYYLSFKLVYS